MRLAPPPRRVRFYLKVVVAIIVLPIVAAGLRLLLFSPSPTERDYAAEMEALLDARNPPPADAERVWEEVEGKLWLASLPDEVGEDWLIAEDIEANGFLPGFADDVAEYETEHALDMAFTLLSVHYPDPLFEMPEDFLYPEAYDRAVAMRWRVEEAAASTVSGEMIQVLSDNPGLRVPASGRLFLRIHPRLGDFRKLAHNAYSRALVGVRDGTPAPLAMYLEALPPIARVAGNDGSPLGPLIAANVAGNAAEHTRTLLRLADLTEPDLARAQAALDELVGIIPEQAHVIELGRLDSLDAIDLAYRGHNGTVPLQSRLIRRLILSHSAEHNRCDRFFDELQAYAELPAHERAVIADPADGVAEKYELAKTLTKGRSFTCWAIDRNRLSVDGTRIMIALQRHRLRTGAYPASLDALVPDELDALPVDGYAADGRFRYRLIDASAPTPRAGYALYSIGIDGNDDGGTPPMDGKRARNALAASPGDDRPPGDYVFTLED